MEEKLRAEHEALIKENEKNSKSRNDSDEENPPPPPPKKPINDDILRKF